MTRQDEERSRRRPGRPERENLRRRVAYERSARGWTRRELARRLALAGCELTQQDLYNLEDPPLGRTPRVVKVDELAALAEVFEVPIADLLLPPEQALAKEIASTLEDIGRHRADMRAAARGLDAALLKLLPLLPAADFGSTINAVARIEGHFLDLIDISLEVEDRLRSGDITTTGRTSSGKHHQAP